MNNYYVLFVKTGYEESIVRRVKGMIDPNILLPFMPYKEKIFLYKGSRILKLELCFPGYIFIETKLSPEIFILEISTIFKQNGWKFSIVNYGSKNDIVIHKEDRELLLKMLNNQFCIEQSKGFIVGDKIRVKTGALVGRESLIRKVNRHKREALIELDFMGGKRQIIVALEILEKV
ncbi:antiterminator LoaP [Kineothrix alysoides]|nr:antiterminator LoaP [Kineothrix alysoides]